MIGRDRKGCTLTSICGLKCKRPAIPSDACVSIRVGESQTLQFTLSELPVFICSVELSILHIEVQNNGKWKCDEDGQIVCRLSLFMIFRWCKTNFKLRHLGFIYIGVKICCLVL